MIFPSGEVNLITPSWISASIPYSPSCWNKLPNVVVLSTEIVPKTLPFLSEIVEVTVPFVTVVVPEVVTVVSCGIDIKSPSNISSVAFTSCV